MVKNMDRLTAEGLYGFNMGKPRLFVACSTVNICLDPISSSNTFIIPLFLIFGCCINFVNVRYGSFHMNVENRYKCKENTSFTF